MTQYAIIKNLISATKVEVEVMRGTACGDSCGSCEACNYASKIRVEARNEVGAMPGDRVEIESQTSKILGAAALIYVVPFVLFFLGYIAAHYLGMSENMKILMSFVFFAVGMFIAVMIGRSQKRKPITFNIVKVIGHGDN